MNRLKKSVVAAGLTAGMIGGGAAGVVFGTPLFVGAQETSTTAPDSTTAAPADSSTTTKAPTTTEAEKKADDKATTDKSNSKDKATDKTDKTADRATRAADRKAKRAERLQATLNPLVKAGTITQAQADAVVKALQEATPEKRAGMGGFDKGGMGRGFKQAGAGLDALTKLLGTTPAELGKLMAGGQTLAQIAESKGVAPQKVIDTLVSATKTGLDEAVKSGRITQADADKKLAEAKTSITERVNNGSFKLGRGGERRFGGHQGGMAPNSDNGNQTAPKTQGD